MKIKPFVSLKGDKKSGYILTVSDKGVRFYQDLPITHDELVMLKKLIDKKSL